MFDFSFIAHLLLDFEYRSTLLSCAAELEIAMAKMLSALSLCEDSDGGVPAPANQVQIVRECIERTRRSVQDVRGIIPLPELKQTYVLDAPCSNWMSTAVRKVVRASGKADSGQTSVVSTPITSPSTPPRSPATAAPTPAPTPIDVDDVSIGEDNVMVDDGDVMMVS